ncbi:MAG: DUF3108 domain-containing protein [Bacteroidales bacterium]|nr:DUF3108 domain-containing protein [Bacteroidales bacterium]
MKHSIFMSIAAAIVCCISASAQDYSYDVHWRWGLVDLNIGEAHVGISQSGNDFSGTITGHSIPWEGRVYSIADTLRASVTPTAESISYVNGWYRKPREGQTVDLNSPANYKNILGQGTLDADDATMEAVTITANMISMFYYASAIDWNSLSDGQTVTIPISGADGSNELKITYNGTSTSSVDGSTPVYSTTFQYSYHGRMLDYPVQCEISQSSHLPILFAADIKIGHVDMALH